MDFITNNLEWILPIITGIISWFASRKFKKAELRSAESEATSGELNNISQNFKVYQELINDLEDRFKKKILDLEDDLERIKVVNKELRDVVGRQERYIKKLKDKISEYEKLEE